MTLDQDSRKKLGRLDYKDAYFLRRFLNSQGKVIRRSVSD